MTSVNDLELLPCPSCGAESFLNLNFREGKQLWYIICDGVTCYESVEGGDPDALVAAWNRRDR